MASADLLAPILTPIGLAPGAPTVADHNRLVYLLSGQTPGVSAGGSSAETFGAPVRLITFDGVGNDAAAFVDGLTGRQPVNLLVQGQHGLHVEIEHSAGGCVLYAYDSGVQIGVPLDVEDLHVGGDLEVDGTSLLHGNVELDAILTVRGDTFLGDDPADAVVTSGPASFGGAVTMQSTLAVVGDTTMTTLHVTPTTPPGNDQAIFVRHNTAVPYFSLGGTNSATPSLTFKDATGLEIVTINPGTAINGLEVLDGDLFAAEAAHITGNLDVGINLLYVDTGSSQIGFGTASPDAGYSFHFVGDVLMEQSLDITETLNVTGIATFADDVTITSGTFRHESSGNARIEADSVGLAFFGADPVARPNVIGTLSGSPTLAQLTSVVRSILAAIDETELGLVTDLTS